MKAILQALFIFVVAWIAIFSILFHKADHEPDEDELKVGAIVAFVIDIFVFIGYALFS